MKNPDQIKKILFITLSNIGDVILTIPTLIRLGQKYRNATIDIIGDARSEILYRHCPLVDIFYKKNKSEGLRGTFNLIKKVRSHNYDLAVDLRSDGLLYFIKADRRLYKIKDKNIHSIEKHFLSLKEGLSRLPDPIIWLGNKDEIRAKKSLSGVAEIGSEQWFYIENMPENMSPSARERIAEIRRGESNLRKQW